MGLRHHFGPPTPQQESWNNLVMSFIFLFVISVVMGIIVTGIMKKGWDGFTGIFIVIGIFWLASLLWFIGSITSKELDMEEVKSVFNLRVIFHPFVLLLGSFFGIIGGVVFAAIISVFFNISASNDIVFWFLFIVGFSIVYILIMIAAREK